MGRPAGGRWAREGRCQRAGRRPGDHPRCSRTSRGTAPATVREQPTDRRPGRRTAHHPSHATLTLGYKDHNRAPVATVAPEHRGARRCPVPWWGPRSSTPARGAQRLWRVRFPSTSAATVDAATLPAGHHRRLERRSVHRPPHRSPHRPPDRPAHRSPGPRDRLAAASSSPTAGRSSRCWGRAYAIEPPGSTTKSPPSCSRSAPPGRSRSPARRSRQ